MYSVLTRFFLTFSSHQKFFFINNALASQLRWRFAQKCPAFILFIYVTRDEKLSYSNAQCYTEVTQRIHLREDFIVISSNLVVRNARNHVL